MKINLNITVCLFILSANLYSQKQGFQIEVIKFLKQNQESILSLAKEIPEEHYDWKPVEGVRTVGEALLHIAGANYYILTHLGILPPKEVDLMNIESLKGKEKIMLTVKSSFDYVSDHILSITDEKLKDKVKFAFGERSQYGALLQLIDHSGEHKGQLIAYARSIGVAPPWNK